MGLLDLPAPLFGWIDAALSWIPALWRVLLWGLLGGAASMWLYGILSPQARIAASKREQLEVRRRLDSFDGELADAWPMIRRLLALSFGQIGRVIGPALLAALPVILLLVWVSTAYGYRFPAGAAPEVRVQPNALRGSWHHRPDGPPRIVVRAAAAQPTVAEVPVGAPVPIIEQRRWWNLLIGNPAGYLSDDGPVERLTFDLPRRELVGVGPGWMRGWEVPFFLAVLIASLVLKRVLRLE